MSKRARRHGWPTPTRRPADDAAQQGEVRPPLATDRRRRTADRRARLPRRPPRGHRRRGRRQRARRSTGTSPTRRRCSSNSSSASAPDCSPAPPTSSPTRRRTRRGARRTRSTSTSTSCSASPTSSASRTATWRTCPPRPSVRCAGRSGSTSRSGSTCCADSTTDLDESDARLMAHATFGLLNSTPHSVRPDAVRDSSRAVLRAMTLAALAAVGASTRRAGHRPRARRAEQPEHRADDQGDDADVGQDRDAEDQAEDDENRLRWRSWRLLPMVSLGWLLAGLWDVDVAVGHLGVGAGVVQRSRDHRQAMVPAVAQLVSEVLK